eukprot:13205-Heterococcus_DN1.PRE.1
MSSSISNLLVCGDAKAPVLALLVGCQVQCTVHCISTCSSTTFEFSACSSRHSNISVVADLVATVSFEPKPPKQRHHDRKITGRQAGNRKYKQKRL